MKQFIITLFISVVSITSSFAQTADQLIDESYEITYEYFAMGLYERALTEIIATEKKIGKHYLLQELKTRCYFHLGDYDKAKQALEVFFTLNADENTKMNMTMLRIQIDSMSTIKPQETKAHSNAWVD